MCVNPSPSLDPHESCAHIMSAVRSTGLTWGTQETPYSLFLTIRKQFLKDAKTRLTTRNPTHTLGVDRGNLQCEQLAASNTEMQLKIQNLETGIERLRTDLESEVSSNENLNIALNVSKSLVDNLNTKYVEGFGIMRRHEFHLEGKPERVWHCSGLHWTCLGCGKYHCTLFVHTWWLKIGQLVSIALQLLLTR